MILLVKLLNHQKVLIKKKLNDFLIYIFLFSIIQLKKKLKT